jgi:imidazolonepropionase
MRFQSDKAYHSLTNRAPGESMPDLALVNAGELVTCHGLGDKPQDKLGVIEDGALLVEKGKVAWTGTTKELRRKTIGKTRRTVDAGGGLVTPGFVDPHTHVVFAGSREDELERKTSGESYTSILASGGGILRTIRDTRAATSSRIVKESRERLEQLLRNGVTTVEVKTGYGQRLADELRMLEVIGTLGKSSKVELVPTFLGLHAKPPEFKTTAEYVDYAILEMLPEVAKSRNRVVFSDCFCEVGVFSHEECSRYLRASRKLGFGLKIHADEFTSSGGASLAAELGCVSADHLGRSDPSGIEAMAGKGVSAVLLPGTSLYSGIPYADARGISESGCRVALATDLSPNSWVESPQMVMCLACTGMKMTPAEALLGCTLNAGRAIARPDIGSLAVGSSADFVVHSLPGYRFLPYRIGGSHVQKVFKRGSEIYSAEGA